MKKVLFLLIAVGILFSQFYIPADIMLEQGQFEYLADEGNNDDSVPLDPMEESPEETESEDSKENKDNDSKKWQQHRLFLKVLMALNRSHWNIPDAKPVIKPHITKIQQPPEGSLLA